MNRSFFRTTLWSSLVAVTALACASTSTGSSGSSGSTGSSGAANSAGPSASASGAIDPQVVRDQDDMTWDDYKPIPGTNWLDPNGKPKKNFKIAIVVADFPDQPFVVTLPKHSDLFGNPQIDPIKREQVPQFYADFWNKPQALNHNHTINEYWMEMSRGGFGISVKSFGPYRMKDKSFQYGMPQEDMPGGYTANRNQNREVDSLWTADAGKDINKQYDVVLRIFAGYDETCVWQEFGEMKFQTKEDIPPEWGNPDPTKPRWAKTRYVDWTSWKSAEWLWSNSAIIQGESSGSIRHEISHFAFKIGDNNNNSYVTPYRRSGAGPWDVMDRGSFNGPGGPHKRYLIPVLQGGAMPAGLLLRQKITFGFLDSAKVLFLNRDGLAKSGLAVADVTAREAEPLPGTLGGIVVRLDGAEPHDRTPKDDPATNPLSPGNPNYDFYTLEAVQRIGYDSYVPDHGVVITKNKDRASAVGGPNSFNIFNWVIDAHPEDVNKLDFKRPHGEPVMRTIADYRQLNDAAFHAGTNSGSQYEWEDAPNRLHFYIVDIHKNAQGVLSYTLAVRSLDGAGPQHRGVALAAPVSGLQNGQVAFNLTNSGTGAAVDPSLHITKGSAAFGSDVYRLSVSVDGAGWNARLPNALAAVKFAASQSVPVAVTRGSGPATVTLKAVSESDPTKVATASYRVQ